MVLDFIKMAKKNWKDYESSDNIFKGKFYSPKGNLIYKGKIENDFFMILIFWKYIMIMDICYTKIKLKIKKNNQIIINY